MTNFLVFHKMNITLGVAENQAWPFSLHKFLSFLLFLLFPFSFCGLRRGREGGRAFE